MDRIEAIKEHKMRRDQKKKEEADAIERRRAELVLDIRALKDRIQKLIETANACIDNGIPITCKHRYSGYDKWEEGHFEANAIPPRKIRSRLRRMMGK